MIREGAMRRNEGGREREREEPEISEDIAAGGGLEGRRERASERAKM